MDRRCLEMSFLVLHGDEQLDSPMLGWVVARKPLYVSDTGAIRMWREASFLQGLELGRVCLKVYSFSCSVGLLSQATTLDVCEVSLLYEN